MIAAIPTIATGELGAAMVDIFSSSCVQVSARRDAAGAMKYQPARS
jgi:hypothetical protein